MRKKMFLFYSLLILCGIMPIQVEAQSQETLKEIRDLIARLLPEHHEQIEVQIITNNTDEDAFEIESADSKVVLKGNNGVSIASALHHYLRTICAADSSWNGNQLHLPNQLPAVPKKIRQSSPYRYRYYLNYVTYSYSMAWWDRARWEKEIDWMALHGINMPLT